MKEANQNREPQIHAQSARLAARMQKELKQLHKDPPHGVCAWLRYDNLLTELEAQIEGPEETVYEKGIFKLQIQVPERYPFEPPNVRFVTAIYHPNIDSGGRICLDILNLPPKGAWRPSLNVATVLASIRCLLAEPNPDDGLMGDISAEYKNNRSTFDKKAQSCTQKYAVQRECQINTSSVNISTPDWALETGEIPNERIDDLEQIKKVALESVSVPQSQINNKVEPKEDSVPIRSTKSLSKRLSLAKESSSEGRLRDNSTKVYNDNVNLQPAKYTDVDVQQKLPTPFIETNENGKKLPHGVGIGNSFGLLENVSKEQGRSVQNVAVTGKENLNPTTWSVEKHPSKFSFLNPLEEKIGMGMKENMKTVPLKHSISGNSNPKTLSIPHNNIPQHGILHEQDPTRSTKHMLPIPGPVQPEDVFKENTNKRVDVDTIIVSDSESDEEPIQVNRSRLSLSQRTVTGKRKFSSNG